MLREPKVVAEGTPSDNTSHYAAATTDTVLVNSEKGVENQSTEDDKGEEPDYASGLKLFILMTSLLLCQFLVALDMVR